jgi:hypothetical protein
MIEILGASDYEFAIGNHVGRLQHVPNFGTGLTTEAAYLGGTVMEWFSRTTSIAGIEIPNWVVVLGVAGARTCACLARVRWRFRAKQPAAKPRAGSRPCRVAPVPADWPTRYNPGQALRAMCTLDRPWPACHCRF